MLSRILKQGYDVHILKALRRSRPLVSLTFCPQQSFTIKKKSSKIWMNEHVNDEYVKKAKLVMIRYFLFPQNLQYNYRSRAAFKLIEINHRYNILKPGYKVIDLGAAPGGWTQVAVETVNSTVNKPLVFSIDQNAMGPVTLICLTWLIVQVAGSVFLQGDIEDEITRVKIKEFLQYGHADVVQD